MPGLLDRSRTVAAPGFNRWLVPPAALCIHLCIGMAYGFSVFWLFFAGGDPLGAQASLFFGSLCLLGLLDLQCCCDLCVIGGAEVDDLVEACDSALGAG